MHFKEFLRETGATARQIHYWRPRIPMATQVGRYYDYHKEDVKKVRLLVEISNCFGGKFSVDALEEVFYNFEEGAITFANDMRLEWSDVDLDEAPD